jgi:hypothetical protein
MSSLAFPAGRVSLQFHPLGFCARQYRTNEVVLRIAYKTATMVKRPAFPKELASLPSRSTTCASACPKIVTLVLYDRQLSKCLSNKVNLSLTGSLPSQTPTTSSWASFRKQAMPSGQNRFGSAITLTPPNRLPHFIGPRRIQDGQTPKAATFQVYNFCLPVSFLFAATTRCRCTSDQPKRYGNKRDPTIAPTSPMELTSRVVRTEDDTVRKTLADLNRRASSAHDLVDSPRKSARALLENERQRKYFPARTLLMYAPRGGHVDWRAVGPRPASNLTPSNSIRSPEAGDLLVT